MLPLPSAAWLLSAFHAIFTSRQTDLRAATSSLASQLSKDAVITFPSDARWADLQIRSTSPHISPSYSVVVEVATEADVAVTVKFAHRLDVPFLAVSGAHGWTTTLNKLPYGIQINMRKLNSTNLSPDGTTATVGGGTLQYEITKSLFAQGKYAVTGLSACVSVAGPLLGGGHSMLQGQYGYSLDNLVSARVVLATGESVETSRSKNSDLFWALQGAGHNFGILTSLVVKTYDIPSNWTVHILVYTADKVEALFNLVNKIESDSARPAKLVLTGVFVRIPVVDVNNPVIAYTVAYEGNKADTEPYAAQFRALGPALTSVSTDVNYVELYTITGNTLDSQPCHRNGNLFGAGTSLPAWDLTGLRKAFTMFGNLTADPRFSTSITLLENYGMKGVRAVNPASTALAPEERQYPVLASPILWWEGDDAQTTRDAYVHVNAMRDAMYTGVDEAKGKRHCYVNYANGVEDNSEIYGYESWRLQRLSKLKKEWDPQNKFGFYNPIV